jgi:hypothetical protein
MESIGAQILLAVPRRDEMFQVYPIWNANEGNENSTEPSIYDCGCKIEREQCPVPYPNHQDESQRMLPKTKKKMLTKSY